MYQTGSRFWDAPAKKKGSKPEKKKSWRRNRLVIVEWEDYNHSIEDRKTGATLLQTHRGRAFANKLWKMLTR